MSFLRFNLLIALVNEFALSVYWVHHLVASFLAVSCELLLASILRMVEIYISLHR